MSVRSVVARLGVIESRFRGFSGGIAALNAPEGTLALYSAVPGTVANDASGEASLFVGELIKQMRSPGLGAEDVFNRTRIAVARASNGERVPWVSSSLVEEFSFARP